MPPALADPPIRREAATDRAVSDAPEHSAPAAPDDRPLVDAARSGDRAAFSRLYERFGALVHGLVLARVARADADDLTQEVFMRAWRSLSTLDDSAAFGPWIASIARNASASWGRSWWRRRSIQPLTEAATTQASGHQTSLSPDEILAAIKRLPPAYHETLILRLFESMTGPQIAQRLGLTHGSVRVNLCKGMQLLRGTLEQDLGWITP